jgi:hypothetical protein
LTLTLILQVCAEGLGTLLKRSWDPAISSQSLVRRMPLVKLPGNPVIIVAPPGPADPRVISRRMRLWNNQLGCLGKVIVINMPTPKGEAAVRTPINHFLFQMVSATLVKASSSSRLICFFTSLFCLSCFLCLFTFF